MAESTLTKPFDTLRRDVGRMTRMGRSFFSGTIAASSGTVTLSDGNAWPTNAANWRIVYGGSTYTVASRTSDTVIVLDVTSGNDVSAGASYVLHPWTDDQVDDIKDIMEDGVIQFLHPPLLPPDRRSYKWKFLRPITRIKIWPDINGTVSGQGSYSDPLTTITATSRVFFAEMIGAAFSFDESKHEYTITSVTSSTVIVVSGDASGEISGDTFTVISSGNYRLPDSFAGIDGDVTYFNRGSVKASGFVTLAGSSGSVSGIKVNSVEIMSGSESFTTSLTVTAAAVAANINANTSDPDYTATSDVATVTITADTAGLGPNTFDVTATTVTLTSTDVNLSGGQDSSGANSYYALKLVNEEQIRHRRQLQTVINAKPYLCAVRPIDVDETIGQRYELITYPVADSAYEVEFRGQINPNVIDATNKYAAGGMPHALTLKESILASAERTLQDGEGVHHRAFLQCLRASIDHDRAANSGESVGFNRDNSDSDYGIRSRHELTETFVTYGGVQYGPNS